MLVKVRRMWGGLLGAAFRLGRSLRSNLEAHPFFVKWLRDFRVRARDAVGIGMRVAQCQKCADPRSFPLRSKRPPPIYDIPIAGWSSLVARQAHNLKVAGSNPAPATTFRFLKVSVAQPFAVRVVISGHAAFKPCVPKNRVRRVPKTEAGEFIFPAGIATAVLLTNRWPQNISDDKLGGSAFTTRAPAHSCAAASKRRTPPRPNFCASESNLKRLFSSPGSKPLGCRLASAIWCVVRTHTRHRCRHPCLRHRSARASLRRRRQPPRRQPL